MSERGRERERERKTEIEINKEGRCKREREGEGGGGKETDQLLSTAVTRYSVAYLHARRSTIL